MNPYIERFILNCRAKGMTKHSIETYQSNVTEFLDNYPKPKIITTDHLRAYLGMLRQRKLSQSTLKGYMSAISSFYDFLLFKNKIQANPIIAFRKRYLVRIKTNRESRQLISIEEMQAVYHDAETIAQKAIIMVLAKTGIRRGELHDLKELDLDFKKKIIHIPTKAKRSNCIAFIDPELDAVLIEYLSWRKDRTKTEFLWLSSKGGRIHKDIYGQIISNIGKRLHLHHDNGYLDQKLTPHCFRHWFTTHLFRAGMNPQYIKFLRGDSMWDESWQIYNRIDIELVRAEYLRYIPQILSRR